MFSNDRDLQPGDSSRISEYTLLHDTSIAHSWADTVQRDERASADVGSDSTDSYKSVIRRGQKRKLRRLTSPTWRAVINTDSLIQLPIRRISERRTIAVVLWLLATM